MSKKKYSKILLVILCIFTVVIISFTYLSDNHESDCRIQGNVRDYLEKNRITNCRIITCPSISDLKMKMSISYDQLNINVTESEVEEYVQRVMDSYDEVRELKNRKTVKNGDLVTVDYSVYYDGKKINQRNDDLVKVGSGNYDKRFEKVLIGMKKNQIYERELIVPEDVDDHKMRNQKEKFKIKVTAINKYITYRLTDQFVKQNLEGNSVAEYKEYAKKKVESEKSAVKKSQLEQELLLDISSKCEFDLDQHEVADYALAIVKKYEQLADLKGLSVEEYAKENGKNSEEFYQMCYQEAEDNIKKILLIGALADQENMQVQNDIRSDNGNREGEKVEKYYFNIKSQVLQEFGL